LKEKHKRWFRGTRNDINHITLANQIPQSGAALNFFQGCTWYSSTWMGSSVGYTITARQLILLDSYAKQQAFMEQVVSRPTPDPHWCSLWFISQAVDVVC
jgi:hypothetical protein